MNMTKYLATILTLTLIWVASPALAGDPPAVGSAAPDFRLQDQNGEWRALDDYRGMPDVCKPLVKPQCR